MNETKQSPGMASGIISAEAAAAAMDAPFGEPVPVYPGLYLVRVPLPHNPLRAINSYFILGEETTTIVDVGFNHPECEQALSSALEALGRTWDNVEIVLTHSHPDHTGNLDRIWKPGMKVYANIHSFKEVDNLMDMEESVFNPLLLQAATPEQRRAMTFESDKPRLHVSAELLPLSTFPEITYVHEGDVLEMGDFSFKVIETPGHNPWHICLYDKRHRIIIVGDHVLPRITPSVMSWFPADNALREFLDSLRKVGGYEADLVLPAHGAPFFDLKGRVDFLLEHHQKRLNEIYRLVADGHDTIVKVSENATWKYPNWLDWPLDQKFFSMGETMAHLIYLVKAGSLEMTICGDEYRFSLPR